ncbi:MAG: protein TolR [Alphaproteobacteria bacterium]
MGMSLSNSNTYSRRRMAKGFTEINLTPMVDVMLVLLIIFMITAPLLTVGVPVDLPKTQAARMNDQTEPLVVSIDAAGNAYLQETRIEQLPLLIERLVAITGQNPDTKIHIRGDRSLSYGRIMEIMGAIAAAGFHKVSLIAEQPMSAKAAPAAKNKPQAATAATTPTNVTRAQ